MWIQLKSGLNLEVRGKMVRYQPGDWIDVGKQYALRLLAEGQAWVPEMRVDSFMSTHDAGVLVTDHCDVGKGILAEFKDELSVECGLPELRWARTFFWDPSVVLQKALLPTGFHLLETWQVVCPLLPYEQLASVTGGNDDKARTEALIGDLRVPLYNPGFCFVKRCGDTERLISYWQEERVDSHDPHHSFLRAIYRAKPLILALPCTWTHPRAVRVDQ